jgi:hypothetical protein
MNTGFKHLGFNLLCSLMRLKSADLTGVVIWAMDTNITEEIKTYLRDAYVYSSNNHSIAMPSNFGIYTYHDILVTPEFQHGGSKLYRNMVFFAYL